MIFNHQNVRLMSRKDTYYTGNVLYRPADRRSVWIPTLMYFLSNRKQQEISTEEKKNSLRYGCLWCFITDYGVFQLNNPHPELLKIQKGCFTILTTPETTGKRSSAPAGTPEIKGSLFSFFFFFEDPNFKHQTDVKTQHAFASVCFCVLGRGPKHVLPATCQCRSESGNYSYCSTERHVSL